jgi:hypothetical protein
MGLIGIFGVLVLVVAVSGCSSTGNSTMSYNGVSFLYPSDMSNATTSGAIISGSKNWQTISFMTNNNVNMQFQSYNGQIDPSSAISADELSVKANNGNVTSTTDTKNPNGVEVFGDIESLVDPSSKNILTYHNMLFTSGGITYSLSLYGSNDQAALDAYNMAVNSLKA